MPGRVLHASAFFRNSVDRVKATSDVVLGALGTNGQDREDVHFLIYPAAMVRPSHDDSNKTQFICTPLSGALVRSLSRLLFLWIDHFWRTRLIPPTRR
jgi:hypothetical protein